MKFSLVSLLAYGLSVEAHSIFQRVSVNGQDQGLLTGLRAPSNNNPVQDVNSQNMICGQSGSKSQTVINVKAGDRIGSLWQHVIGGAQFSGDPDNPIAHSHKGPVMAYLAKVDNAASASQTGLKWFKIWQDGFDTSSKTWGVDNLIKNNGWVYFHLPQCLAPGQYLLRVEVLALHSAYQQGQAQFYQSCAQINVSGSGSFSPSQTVSIPGVYSATDPSILINIYGSTGQPDNGGKAYNPPGPAPISC
ncbi:glycoside hydrolase family 61 protein [Thermothielavioides terrestris NRRL 8126]|uniref:lytic cellulose monooxygenase (C4-dehydrogenating) n=1 Tax=Thermothielavioides terrestris (strain ATCC 38088 / NRRL 8126) TaxID=578455 RepID=G2QQL2_THETT|nr:glycoside hydrolase family 61 protein [Thermothielavioides terrestris NRRL 8126]AEO62422.1 glycoside hydrolase family 61 protein [Thermothielavioides terrestris NRRL 8126]